MVFVIVYVVLSPCFDETLFNLRKYKRKLHKGQLNLLKKRPSINVIWDRLYPY